MAVAAAVSGTTDQSADVHACHAHVVQSTVPEAEHEIKKPGEVLGTHLPSIMSPNRTRVRGFAIGPTASAHCSVPRPVRDGLVDF
jgi:hypothetical protein